MDIKAQFGQKIRELRKAKWWSQEELWQEAWLHRTYIGIVERGEKNISLENIKKLADTLNTPIKSLF